MKTIIYPKPLNGTLSARPSKALTEKALICSALCKEPSTIYNPLICDETLKIINALELLGVNFKLFTNSIKITPPKKFKYISEKIKCENSRSVLRILVPLLTYLQDGITFECDSKITEEVLDDDFENFCFNYLKTQNTLTFSKLSILKEITISSNSVSKTISGYLLSTPIFDEDTTIIIKSKKIDKNIETTLDVMANYGIEYNLTQVDNNTIIKIFKQNYTNNDYYIEGDYLSSANYLISGLFNNEIKIKNLNKNSIQKEKEIVNILKSVNANLTISYDYLISKKSNNTPLNINLNHALELAPSLIAFSTLIPGKNILTGLNKINEKNIYKLNLIIQILIKLGANIKTYNDYLLVEGVEILEGGVEINIENDQQILEVLFSISSMIKKPITLINSDKLVNSNTEVWNQFRLLGGEFFNQN